MTAMTLLTLELPGHPEPSSLAEVRRSLRTWLSEYRVPEAMVADLCLVATELVANAREASAGVNQPIEISCEVLDRRVHLVVRDWGPGDSVPTPDRLRADQSDEDSVRGRGLSIVRTLTDEISFERNGSATYVRVVAGFPANGTRSG